MSRQPPPTSSSASFETSGSSYAATRRTSTDSRTALVSQPASTSEQAADPGSQPKHGGARERLAALSKGLAQKIKDVARQEKKKEAEKKERDRMNEKGEKNETVEQNKKDEQKIVPKPASITSTQAAMTERQRMEAEHEKTLASKFSKDLAFCQDQARAGPSFGPHALLRPSPFRQQPSQAPGRDTVMRPLPPRQYYPDPRPRVRNPDTGTAPMPPPKDKPKSRKGKRTMSQIQEEDKDTDDDFNFWDSSEEEKAKEHKLKGLSAPPRHHYNRPPNPPRTPPPTGA